MHFEKQGYLQEILGGSAPTEMNSNFNKGGSAPLSPLQIPPVLNHLRSRTLRSYKPLLVAKCVPQFFNEPLYSYFLNFKSEIIPAFFLNYSKILRILSINIPVRKLQVELKFKVRKKQKNNDKILRQLITHFKAANI